KLDPDGPLDGLVADLTKALAGKDEKEREKAAEALGRLGPKAKAAVPALVKLLKAGTPAQREQAVRALGKMGPAAREAVPALLQALRDEETDRRLTADSPFPVLQSLLPFRAAVADALGDIGADPKVAVPALLAVIKETKQNPSGVIKLDALTLNQAA